MKQDSPKFSPFDGDGEMRARMRAHDWAASPLGHPDTWPHSLTSLVSFMLDSKPPMCISWGADLTFLYNDAYIEFLDTKHPQALGRCLQDVWADIWPDIHPIAARTLAGESCYFENAPFVIARREWSGPSWFTFSYSPARDDRGEVAGIITLLHETTHQVLAERRQAFLLQLTDRLRGLGEPDEITAAVTESLGLELNVPYAFYAEIDEAGEMFHVRRDWVAPGTASLAGRNGRLGDFGSAIIARLRSGATVTVNDVAMHEYTASHADAYIALGLRALLVIPLVKAGRLIATLNLHHDRPYRWSRQEIQLAEEVAERTWAAVERARAEERQRQVENELREVAARLQFALRSAQVGEWDLDLINDTSRRSLRHDQCFGYTEPVEEWGFETFIRHVHPDDRAEVEQKFQAAMSGMEDWHFECRVIWPDGSIHWIGAHGSIYQADVKPTRMLGIVFDITERKRSEEALRTADRRKDEFLAMLAHELRNPLAPISAAAEILKLVRLDEVRVKQTSDIITRQVRHMTGLVDDLLDVSRVTRGLVTLDREPVDVKRIVSDAVEQVRPLVEARRHHLAVHLAPEAASILGDHKRLVQVVTNLLNNAAKYTPEGGSIELRMEVRREHVMLRVLDNGIGMAPELVTRAFELFAQAERTSDRSQGGLGLGLALVKSLVELHGGSVSAFSAGASRGSEFTVCLPRLFVATEQPAHRHDNPISRPAGKTLRVMVVDDNADAAQTLAMFVQALGHEVFIEYESRSALERARDYAPDVCLLDIGLPDMDGNELARRLRALPQTGRAALVAVTGYGQEQDRDNAVGAGFDQHFVKPVDTTELAALLAKIASR